MREIINIVENANSGNDLRAQLESRWNDPAFLKRYEPLFRNYHCETIAEVIKRIEPNTQIWGFSDNENPGTAYFSDDGDDGHHFAVVSNRYIVDPWMFSGEGKSVWDLNDPTDSQEIKSLYGDPKRWTKIERPYEFTNDADYNAP